MNHREYWAVLVRLEQLHQECFGRHTGIRRRNIACRIEEDGNVDIANPAVGVAPVNEIHNYSNDGLDSQ